MSVPLSHFPPAMPPESSGLDAVDLDDFVSEEAIQRLVEAGQAQRDGALLRTRDGRRFVLVEALRILGNASHQTDPYGMTGTTDTLGAMLKRGFVMSAGRVQLGRQIYDVEHGFVPQPMRDPDASGVNPVVR